MLFKSLAAVALLAQSAAAAAIAAAPAYKNMAYYTNYDVYTSFQPQQLNVPYLTHVIYAFCKISDKGEVLASDPYADYQILLNGDVQETGNNAYGNIKQLFIHKKNNRKLKTLLSIGGFSNSQLGQFTAASTTAAGRQLFAKSAVKLMADWGFDGIDIDWEYPTWIADGKNFVYLLQEVRKALDAYAVAQGQTYHYLLTVATSAGPDKYAKYALGSMNPLVDSINLMAYDYAGAWDSTTGHQSAIYPSTSNPLSTKVTTSKAVADYLAKGVSASKLLIGIPLYGRSFANTHGLGKSYDGTGKGSIEKGVWLFKDLPRPGAKVMTDTALGVTYTYDSATTEFVTLDGSASVGLKANFLKSKALGGAFFWESAGDKTGTSSLIRVMAQNLGTLDSSLNQLSYPASVYDNIKAGLPNN